MKLNTLNSHGKFIAGVLLILLVALALNYDKSDAIGRLYDNLATPGKGESEVLPEQAQLILKYARTKQVKSISISPGMAKNRFIAQPLTEGIYPIVVKDPADIYVSYSIEAVPSDLVTLRIEKGIRIATRR